MKCKDLDSGKPLAILWWEVQRVQKWQQGLITVQIFVIYTLDFTNVRFTLTVTVLKQWLDTKYTQSRKSSKRK